MGIGTVFVDQGCHAVRFPADISLPEGVRQVSVRAKGHELIVTPLDHTWDSFFLDGRPVSDDFLPERADQFQRAREAL